MFQLKKLKQNIYSACHLIEAFAEVIALQTFRLKNCVTQLFNYGYDEDNYFIIMKR